MQIGRKFLWKEGERAFEGDDDERMRNVRSALLFVVKL